jgi:hypothetical protein
VRIQIVVIVKVRFEMKCHDLDDFKSDAKYSLLSGNNLNLICSIPIIFSVIKSTNYIYYPKKLLFCKKITTFLVPLHI